MYKTFARYWWRRSFLFSVGALQQARQNTCRSSVLLAAIVLLTAITTPVANAATVNYTTCITSLVSVAQPEQVIVSAHDHKGTHIPTVDAAAQPGQELEKINVTVGLENESLETLFLRIEGEVSITFAYVKEVVAPYTRISLPKQKRSVKATLDLAFKGLPISYEANGRSVVVFQDEVKKPKGTSQVEEGASAGTVNAAAEQQTIAFTVKGTITDAKSGEALPGVNVLVKGTSRGTTTDVEGHYRVDVQNQDVLVFSFIGYETQEVAVNAMKVIDVLLAESLHTLDEVVVNAGYWEVSPREGTGNIRRVSAADIEKQPVANPLSALQGRVPGVYIRQETGIPGGSFSIQIRGQNSLRTLGDGNGDGNLPLYIIDGVPYPSGSIQPGGSGIQAPVRTNPLSNINPADIASIDILKDADATAIYGSRGANGVVLITTKKGRPGKSKVDLNVYKGVGRVGRFIDLLNTRQYVAMRKEALANDGLEPSLDSSDSDGTNGEIYAPDLLLWDTTRYTDWQKKLIGGTAHVLNAQLSLSGGNAHTQFLCSGGYFSEGTVFPGDFKSEKGSGRVQVSHASENKKFKADVSVSYFSEKNNLPAGDIARVAPLLQPNAPAIFNQDGELNWEGSTWENPYATLLTRYRASTNNLVTNTSISYEIVPGLQLKSVFGYNMVYSSQFSKKPLQAINPNARSNFGGRRANIGSSRLNTWIFEPQAAYERMIGRGKLTFLLGSTLQKNSRESLYLDGRGFVNDAAMENVQAAPELSISVHANTVYKYAALFGRLNYNYQGKYIVNLTGRRDGSSRFGADRRFANFGAVGAAWIFSKDPFIQDQLRFLSFGKLSGSYGITGSDAIPDYRYLDTYTTTAGTYNGNIGLVPTRIANDDFSWEENKKLEVALQLGFLKDRLTLTGSWYRNQSSNQLVDYTLSLVTGHQGISANLPATIQNTGLELELATTNIQSGRFTWTTSLNISFPRNKLISYPNLQASPYVNRYAVGRSLNITRVFTYTGLDPETGLHTLKDVNGDGIISETYDQKFIDVSRDYFGGFQNSLTYAGFQLDMLFQFARQTTRDWLSKFPMPGAFQYGANQPVEVLNRWRKAGDITQVQRFSTLRENFIDYSYFRDSDKAIAADGSFIKLKNIALSYQVSRDWIERSGLSSFRMYVLAQNVFTITRYRGYDPDLGAIGQLPPLFVITAGIQVTL